MYKESRQPFIGQVDPETARYLLTINTLPKQRKLDQESVRLIADNMRNKTHRRAEFGIAYDKETGIKYLVNGQHTASALIIYGKPYPGAVSYYSCDDMNDVLSLYETYDVHTPKTERLFMGMRKGTFGVDGLNDCPLAVLNACGTALLSLGAGTSPQFYITSKRSKSEKVILVEKYADDVLFVRKYAEAKHLIAVPIVTAMIATRRANPKAAEVFWDSVNDGAGLSSTDPRMKLRNTLMTKTGPFHTQGRERVAAIFSYCVCWWNSWRKGEDRRSVKLAAMNEIPKLEN